MVTGSERRLARRINRAVGGRGPQPTDIPSYVYVTIVPRERPALEIMLLIKSFLHPRIEYTLINLLAIFQLKIPCKSGEIH